MLKGVFGAFARPTGLGGYIGAAIRLAPRPVLLAIWELLEPFPGSLGCAFRYPLLVAMAGRVGAAVVVAKHVEVRCFDRLTLGDRVSIQRNTYIDASGGVTIGSDVSVAHHCSIVAFNHAYENDKLPIRENAATYSGIEIGSDVWIGAGVRVLDGSRIGGRSVVAAGAVVTGRFEGKVVLGGVPARVMKAMGPT